MVRRMTETEACRYCGETIHWAMDARRRRVAVEPVAGGPLVLFPAAPGSSDPQIREVADMPGNYGIRTLRYRRHSDTCSERGKRKKGRA